MTTLTEALAPASDQLTADSLISGPRTITFTAVKIGKDGRSTRVSLNYEGDDGKPFKPCKTMGRAMVMVWGITEGRENDFVGKSVTVFRDPDVSFGEQGKIGGVRISHMSHISKAATVKLTVAQGSKRAFVFQPLAAASSKPDATIAWADKAIAQIDAANSITDLAEVHAKITPNMGKLATANPEQHARVTAALSGREQTLAQEGPADEQRGDPFADSNDDLLAA